MIFLEVVCSILLEKLAIEIVWPIIWLAACCIDCSEQFGWPGLRSIHACSHACSQIRGNSIKMTFLCHFYVIFMSFLYYYPWPDLKISAASQQRTRQAGKKSWSRSCMHVRCCVTRVSVSVPVLCGGLRLALACPVSRVYDDNG
jgi:hypothetical protein